MKANIIKDCINSLEIGLIFAEKRRRSPEMHKRFFKYIPSQTNHCILSIREARKLHSPFNYLEECNIRDAHGGLRR